MGQTIEQSVEQVRAFVTGGSKPEELGLDGFPLFADDPLAPFHRQLNIYLREIPSQDRQFEYMCHVKPNELPAGKAILNLEPDDLAQTLRAIVVRLQYKLRTKGDQSAFSVSTLVRAFKIALKKDDFTQNRVLFRSLISDLLRSHLPLTADDLATLIRMVANRPAGWWQEPISPEGLVHTLERHAAPSGDLPNSVREELEKWLQKLDNDEHLDSSRRKLLNRIGLLLGRGTDSGIESGEAWSNAALDDLKKMIPPMLKAWAELLQHCVRADSSKPTQKWIKAAKDFTAAIGRENFKSHIIKWFDLVALPRPVHREPSDAHYGPDPDQLIADGNASILKGLAWSCAGWEDPEISRALSRLAQVCFKKVRNLGPRCPRVGNACLYSLGATKSQDVAAELSRLDQVVKPPSAKRLIGKSLNKAAELTGQTRADLEEATVPNYGLDASGSLKESFGDFVAEVSITGLQAFEILWRKSDGKTQKSVPAEVKEKHADQFKKFKRNVQDIEKMLPAQRIRIERLLLSERTWSYDKWRERYLDHPLLSTLTRRLIWHFCQNEKSALGIWLNGQIVALNDKLPLDFSQPSSIIVRLWHPIGTEAETVSSWRRWLESHEIVQPFKQAHREVYILTDAELRTATYSNRFAAHIIRQHQFTALAKERGWNYRLQGAFDSHNVPTLLLGPWDLAAEFWVDSVGGRQDTSASGIFLNLSTDQVRFTNAVGDARPLSEVPALVFSEVMRDVDLFVGVCSIGNDPTWQDNGEAQGATTYWRNYSFGDLSASAATRKDVLLRLVPKLRIASQCSFKDRYLVVQGTFRTYKIHLGSGNILMEPNDRYLCIVADRGARGAAANGERVFLPFEGDSTLSLILSKAFLLADDSKITDSSILNQIRV